MHLFLWELKWQVLYYSDLGSNQIFLYFSSNAPCHNNDDRVCWVLPPDLYWACTVHLKIGNCKGPGEKTTELDMFGKGWRRRNKRPPETLKCSKSKVCWPRKMKYYQNVYLTMKKTFLQSFSLLGLQLFNWDHFKVSGGLAFASPPPSSQ